jgi:hypothetical protein
MTAAEHEHISIDDPDLPANLKAGLRAKKARQQAGGGRYGAEMLSVIEWTEKTLADPADDEEAVERKDTAREIEKLHRVIKSKVASGDADGAARFALRLGRLIEAEEMKHRWQSSVDRGRAAEDRQRSLTEAAAVKRREITEPLRIEAARIIRARSYAPTITLSSVAREVAGDRDEKDVRDAIKSLFRKRPDGRYEPDREAIEGRYPV